MNEPARAALDGIAAVVFDFDGTLADTTPCHEQALRAALQHHGLNLDHEWYSLHAGLSIRDLLARLPGARHLPLEEIIGHSRARLLATIRDITPVRSTVTLLRAARNAGLPCAIASGASRLLVQPGLETLGLTSEFAAVVTAEDVPRGKPAPDLYSEAARLLGVLPGRCLAVDDAADGVAAARAAGMRVLTLADGHLVPAAQCGVQVGQGAASRCPPGTGRDRVGGPPSAGPAGPSAGFVTQPSAGGA